MPKSKEYLSSSDSESADSDEPKPKKKKPVAKPTPKPEKDSKSDKKDEKAGPTKNSSGESMFQISKMRFATVSEFRGKAMVNIREYYEKDGELRPGKKGISLSIDQWEALKEKIPDIDECVKKL
ncbi:activated RNA polymerase II transcriptional coactivator p15 [Biomphalaria glabrata]|uniref:Activated RNA polymerase II transcriptional coactivator p15-like n=1 Tax=Biomphalaria glabrata TaxID=6526 RepID=A0A2C9LNL7_BIOGL|nr:activated RNA polymerase II transcriptional coactivator p15-like [Biomphalaria glabrata]XP_013087444.1 activated RNA polymerase II transcriptional coactivator p15-like [Biomphalaria glabrata]KAI8755595.1 activated RNA polymerase II transcriptional coactivator p15-like [Biomphalaria glabrata]